MDIKSLKKILEPLGFKHEEGFKFSSEPTSSLDFYECKEPKEVTTKIYETGIYHGICHERLYKN